MTNQEFIVFNSYAFHGAIEIIVDGEKLPKDIGRQSMEFRFMILKQKVKNEVQFDE